MNIDIFVRSYVRDYLWLQYLLKSIAKFVTGHNNVIIVVPESDKAELDGWGLTKEKVYTCKEPAGMKGYHAQQLSKLNADCYSEADYICFVDSDCFFFRPFDLEKELFKDGKPILMKTPYKELDVPWKPITEKTLGFEVEYETMRRLPLTYRSDMFRNLRAHIESVHGKSINDYVASVDALSEFNALGSYILKHYPDTVSQLDTSKDEIPQPWLFQAWSWGGLTPEIKTKYDRLLA